MTVHNPMIRPGMILEGEIFPEPIRVIWVQPLGLNVKIGGQGLRSSRYYERLLSQEQIRTLKATPAEAPFDGDAHRFRLGIEAARLGLAFEYDP